MWVEPMHVSHQFLFPCLITGNTIYSVYFRSDVQTSVFVIVFSYRFCNQIHKSLWVIRNTRQIMAGREVRPEIMVCHMQNYLIFLFSSIKTRIHNRATVL